MSGLLQRAKLARQQPGAMIPFAMPSVLTATDTPAQLMDAGCCQVLGASPEWWQQRAAEAFKGRQRNKPHLVLPTLALLAAAGWWLQAAKEHGQLHLLNLEAKESK